jgi:sucrose phosphorylase
LKGLFSTIHFLPFFPYSSDDGFSVIDFFSIDPRLGSWQEVSGIGNDFELMLDFVINHFSAQSPWFNNFLQDVPGFQEFAIVMDPATDLFEVTRPRALPLLTEFAKADGERVHVWTTFGPDQIDFNYKSLEVLETMLEVLLFYVEQGASILRLDAIAYLWKEVGTTCIHLDQTHAMVKLLRSVLDQAAPDAIILTETNVPHPENIGYFGDGRDEAQMVYNFTLPPLLLYSFVQEDATLLSQWAGNLKLESEATTFFNFTASHDGIGVRPLEGVLPPSAIDDLARLVKSSGGKVSYKQNTDGSQSPYELNITYVDAILGAAGSQQTEKFLASQAVSYVLPGVPATYIHSLLGSRNWIDGVAQTGRARTINREKLDMSVITAQLNDPRSFRARIFFAYRHLIETRVRQPAFHPNAAFEIIQLDPRLFIIRRFCETQIIVAATNISAKPIVLPLLKLGVTAHYCELLSGRAIFGPEWKLAAYGYGWFGCRI